MTFASKLALLGGLASTALAHGTVTSFTTDGKENQGFLLDYYYMEQNGETPPEHFGWYAENLDNGFVEPASFGEPDIICHKNARPATATASVAAGGVVEFQWTEWPDSHIGPVLTYVANCGGDCADVDKETLQWVKIDEAGYDAETGQWAAIALIESGNKWATTVPETLAPGNYVFRHEIIALHGAGSENGAQNYPQCFNIEITGTGTDNPEGVLGTELYTADEPGILYDPYTGDDSGYVIPGPALYGSGSTTPGEPIPPVNSTAPVPGPTGTGSVPSATETGSDLPEVTIPVEDPAEDGEAGVPSETQSTDTSAGPFSTGGAGAQPTSSPEDPSDGNDGSDESAGEGPNSGSDNGSVQPPAGGNGGSEDGNDSGNVGGFPSLPETFTLQSFIQWLQQIAGSTNARRHARDVRVL